MYRYVLLSLFVSFLFSCQTKQFPVVKRVSKQLANWRVQNISNVEYDLQFNIPVERSMMIRGTEAVRFQLADTDENLQLDFKADSSAVFNLICNGKPVSVEIKNGHLVISSSFLKKGKNELSLEFDAPDLSLNRNPDFLYTLFVPDRASTAFPCFDQPNLKARFGLTLQIPSSWKAVANGPEKSMISKDTVQQVQFEQTLPLPTYLFAFAAGKFDTISRQHDGKTYTLYHRETNQGKLKNNVDDIFNLVFLSLESIESYTGMKYPFQKYDFVAVPSFQYGGMEHAGAVLYRASSLFLEGKPTRNELLYRANLIAHETAHMWFGDLVTMPWFDEVWLKEVYANFIADKVVSPLFPEFNQDLLFLLAHNYSAYSVDRTAGANPIGQPLENMKDAGTLYGSIIYHKAPVVMNKLEQRIGKVALQKGLRQYLQEYAFGNAGWDDLIGLLDTDGSLKQWSENWVYEAGRPHLKARNDQGDLVIDQIDPEKKNRNWPQTIDVVWMKDDSLHSREVKIDGKETRIDNLLPSDGVDWFYLNGDGNAYAFVEINEAAQQFLEKNLASLNDDVLRAAIWTDLYENRMEGHMTDQQFLQTAVNNLPKEKSQVIYERILAYLQDVYLYRADQKIRKDFQLPIEHLIWDQLAKNEDSRNALMNVAIRICTSNESLDRLYAIWSEQQEWKGYKPTEKQLTDLAFYLALRRPDDAKAILNTQEPRIENEDQKERFQFIRKSLDPEKKARDAFFQSLLKVENREHEPWVNDALAFLNFPGREEESNAYILPSLDVLQEIQETGDIFFPKSWLDNLLEGHQSAKAADIVRRFLADHPDYPKPLKRKILQSADFLLKNNPLK